MEIKSTESTAAAAGGTIKEPIAQHPADEQQMSASDEAAQDGVNLGSSHQQGTSGTEGRRPETLVPAPAPQEMATDEAIAAAVAQSTESTARTDTTDTTGTTGTTDPYAAVRSENERLRAEVDSLHHRGQRRGTAHSVRRVLAGTLMVLTCLTLLLSTVTVWADQTFLSSDARWTAIVGPIGQDPKVVNAVSAYVADQVVTVLQVQQRAQNALPPQGQFLAVPITDVVHQFAQKGVAKAMSTEQFQQAWIAVNSTAHTQVVAALRGQSKAVTITNGTVTLNLLPVITQGLQTVRQQIAGLLPEQVQLPPPRSTEEVQQGIQKLSQALGVQLPPNFGQVTLLQSDQLATAQQVVRALDMFSILLPVITVVLLVAMLLLSVDRRRTLIQLGIGIAIVFVLAKIVIGILQQQIVAAVASPTAKEIIQPVIERALSYLFTSTTWLLVLGVVVAMVAFLVGKPAWFRAGYAKLRQAYAAASDWIRRQVRRTGGTSGSTPVGSAA